MRKVVIALAVLAACAAFAAPALAAPSGARAEWGGWGVTTDNPYTDFDVVGDTVHFAGQASLGDRVSPDYDSYYAKGQGIFKGTLDGDPIRIQMRPVEGAIRIYPLDTFAIFDGLADVTYRGTVYHDIHVLQSFVKYPPSGGQQYSMYIYEQDGWEEHAWRILGVDVIKGVFFKVRVPA